MFTPTNVFEGKQHFLVLFAALWECICISVIVLVVEQRKLGYKIKLFSNIRNFHNSLKNHAVIIKCSHNRFDIPFRKNPQCSRATYSLLNYLSLWMAFLNVYFLRFYFFPPNFWVALLLQQVTKWKSWR